MARFHLEHVARAAGNDMGLTVICGLIGLVETIPEFRYVEAESVGGVGRWSLWPQGIGDPVAGHHAVRVNQEESQERALSGRTEFDLLVIASHNQRSQDPKLHTLNLRSGAGPVDAADEAAAV